MVNHFICFISFPTLAASTFLHCDVCNQMIHFIRYSCIICREEDASNAISMCAECIDSPVFNKPNKYIHHPSHTLIRFTRRFHFGEVNVIIPAARARSDRVKASFKALEEKESDTKEQIKKASKAFTDRTVRSKPFFIPLVCACCGKNLTLPCWACIICGIPFPRNNGIVC